MARLKSPTSASQRPQPDPLHVQAIIATVRDLPFAVVEDRSISFLIRHGIGSCTVKHQMLDLLLRDAGVDSRLVHMLVEYDFERTQFHRLCPEFCTDGVQPHTALQIWWEGDWILLDITFDRFLAPEIPVNMSLLTGGFSIGHVHRIVPQRSESIGRRAHLGLETHSAVLTAEQRRHYKAINRVLSKMRHSHLTEILDNHRQLLSYVERLDLGTG